MEKQDLVGKRVRCIRSADPHSPVPVGTEGTVVLVDDLGTIFVEWDNGSRLGLVPGVDRWEVLS
jgi:hypothetical protein